MASSTSSNRAGCSTATTSSASTSTSDVVAMIRRVRPLAALFAVSICAALPAATMPGPRNVAFAPSEYAVVRYVDPKGSDEAGDGSAAHPWATLEHALELAPPAAGKRAAILVSQGRYRTATLQLKSRIDVFGGFAKAGGARDIAKFVTTLDADEATRIAIGADDAHVDGIAFINGRIRGKGAALLCDGASPTITNCTFIANRTVIPRDWEPPQMHLTANDGGAVMCLNGAAPRFDSCLFYHN